MIYFGKYKKMYNLSFITCPSWIPAVMPGIFWGAWEWKGAGILTWLSYYRVGINEEQHWLCPSPSLDTVLRHAHRGKFLNQKVQKIMAIWGSIYIFWFLCIRGGSGQFFTPQVGFRVFWFCSGRVSGFWFFSRVNKFWFWIHFGSNFFLKIISIWTKYKAYNL